MTILDVMRDPRLLGEHFGGPEWDPWRTALSALFGLRISDRELLSACTGREPPLGPFREAWFLCGRRAGKSRISALVLVYVACFVDWPRKLAPGESAVVMCLASDRRQARVVLEYVKGLLRACPMLSTLIVAERAEGIELNTGITIEVHTSSFRAIRGYTVVAAVLDEVAFWNSDDGSANPDTEVVAALRPALATTGGLLLGITSPHSRRGVAWDAYREHYGKPSDVLVWRAPTRTMNPSVPAKLIERELKRDEARARSEWLAEFRTDLEAFVTREVVEQCIVPGRFELPPLSKLTYRAFVDPSGGSADSMTLAIAHIEKRAGTDVVVIDAIREVRPPFSPDQVVEDFAKLLKTYRISEISGDRYAGEWPRERFRVHGITYEVATKIRSDLYRDMLPRLNAATVELLDSPKLVAQLVGLERRTSRSGRDSIDHGQSGHDDVVNAVAGAVALCDAPRPVLQIFLEPVD